MHRLKPRSHQQHVEATCRAIFVFERFQGSPKRDRSPEKNLSVMCANVQFLEKPPSLNFHLRRPVALNKNVIWEAEGARPLSGGVAPAPPLFPTLETPLVWTRLKRARLHNSTSQRQPGICAGVFRFMWTIRQKKIRRVFVRKKKTTSLSRW